MELHDGLNVTKAAIKNRAEQTAEGPAIPRKSKDPGSRAYPKTTSKVTVDIAFYCINTNNEITW